MEFLYKPKCAIIRHSIRADESLNFDSPQELLQHQISWDPSITLSGHTFAYNVAKQQLSHISFDKVVSSPFLRCLQTTVQIMKALNIPLQKLEIDAAWSEVFHCISAFQNPEFEFDLEKWENDIRNYLQNEFQCSDEEKQNIPISWKYLPKLRLPDHFIARVLKSFHQNYDITTLYITHLQPLCVAMGKSKNNFHAIHYCAGCILDQELQITKTWGMEYKNEFQ